MRKTGSIAALLAGAAILAAPALALEAKPEGAVRVATFNASLNRTAAGGLIADLSGGNAQAMLVAEIIQRANPDVILIAEFDYDEDGMAARLFVENYLAVGQNGAEPWVPVAMVSEPVNTGVPSGIDFNRDGNPAGPDDAYGFGFFPGQYGMLVLSKLPIAADDMRTFQTFLWADMPGALLPDDAETPAAADYYSTAALAVFRLSSKSHWDIPVEAPGGIVHILASHPTPPVFDGPEDRNGRRNADEVRFWLDYVTPGAGAYIYDDAGVAGGLAEGAQFVVVGDLNLDPNDGDGIREMGQRLVGSDMVQDPRPMSVGGAEDAIADGGKNLTHAGDPALDTADFADTRDFDPGNLRADYTLPSVGLEVVGAAVFWPAAADPLSYLWGTPEAMTSDHHLVYVDIMVE